MSLLRGARLALSGWSELEAGAKIRGSASYLLSPDPLLGPVVEEVVVGPSGWWLQTVDRASIVSVSGHCQLVMFSLSQ